MSIKNIFNTQISTNMKEGVDAAHWWWLRRDPHTIVKRFGCMAIHNKSAI